MHKGQQDNESMLTALDNLLPKKGRRAKEEEEEGGSELLIRACDPQMFSGLSLSYEDCLARIQDRFPNIKLTPQTLRQKCEEIRKKVVSDGSLGFLQNAFCLPVVLPGIRAPNYKTALSGFMKEAMRGFKEQYPDDTFAVNATNSQIDGVRILDSSRHERLFQRLTTGRVCGLMFFWVLPDVPTSQIVPQLNQWPENISLVGGIDMSVAIATYPDILASQPAIYRTDAIRNDSEREYFYFSRSVNALFRQLSFWSSATEHGRISLFVSE
jgi:hypothetical protein